MDDPPDEPDVSAGFHLVLAASARPAPASGRTRTTAASAGTRRRRRTTYGTTEDPPLSGAYGVSCRARAERAALGLVMSPFAPGRPSTGRPSGGSPAPHQADSGDSALIFVMTA